MIYVTRNSRLAHFTRSLNKVNSAAGFIFKPILEDLAKDAAKDWAKDLLKGIPGKIFQKHRREAYE